MAGILTGACLALAAGCADDARLDADPGSGPEGEPTATELGLRLAPVPLDLAGLSPSQVEQVARGSYLVNGASLCSLCHTRHAGYLAGGLEIPLFPEFRDPRGFTSVLSRNLTPDPATGLTLSEAEFIEVMQTGKDFTDSAEGAPQALIAMPFHVFRFMSVDDLKAIYAYLRRIPPVAHQVRKTWSPPFPFPPAPMPPIGEGDPVDDPDNAERGLAIPRFFSAGPAAEAFVGRFERAVAALPAERRARVGRGSYLINAVADCSGCHTGDRVEFGGLVPGTDHVNTAVYLAGGANIGRSQGLSRDVFARNLTPDPETGLFLTEQQFIQTLRFGADFRRPGGSLRLAPHFPTEFRLTLDDLKAVYAYLQTIPPVRRAVVVTD